MLRRTVSFVTLVLIIAVVASMSAAAQQVELASEMVRLHVVANSDTAADQQLKLQVRDAVLASVDASLSLTAVETAARIVIIEAGYDYDVTVRRGVEAFTTREYDSFRLPAGDYDTVRVTIGEGAGQNWWCVLFPPLCFASVEQFETTAVAAGLTEDDITVMNSNGVETQIKFRILEILSGWFR